MSKWIPWITGAQLLSGYSGYRTARENEKARRGDARREDERGRIAASEKRRLSRARQGDIRARLAASGVRINEGTAVDLVAYEAAQGEIEARNALYESAMRARNLRIDANNQRAQGFNVLLGGATNAATTYLDLKNKQYELTGEPDSFKVKPPQAPQ